jgi:hypothetical protein
VTYCGDIGGRAASASLRSRSPNDVAARPRPNGLRRGRGDGGGMVDDLLTEVGVAMLKRDILNVSGELNNWSRKKQLRYGVKSKLFVFTRPGEERTWGGRRVYKGRG